MKAAGPARKHPGRCAFFVFALLLQGAIAQTDMSSERAFPQSKNAIEQALQKLQPSMAGRLPVLDGFVASSDYSLDRYRRGYYQSTVQVTTTSSGSSIVRVTTKVTAWYLDPRGPHSGYRLLTSNGRLEADLLDQLADELSAKSDRASAASSANTADTVSQKAGPPKPVEVPKTPAVGTPFSTPLTPTLPSREQISGAVPGPHKDVNAEIKSLEDVLHNQGHPNSLVAVKQSGTAVVASPSITAKTLFLASAHDEFEMLDFNADWVHVRISGLSRGWIWRNSVEMPDGIPDTVTRKGSGPAAAAEQLFHVSREELAAFPGDWEPLRGKSVKILSIEKNDQTATDTGTTMRLEFAKSVLDKKYDELAQKADTVAGIVLIFDSADGGMIAATLPALRQWKAGALLDSAFWHQCFFDPPEMLGGSGASASQ